MSTAFSGIVKFLSELTEQTTAADTDVMPIGATSPRKITIANLKEVLGINSLNRNIGIVIEDISKRSIKTAFALMEGNSDFVLPSFTQICTVTAQTGSSVSVHSIIGAQTSASSVIGTPIGNTQNIYMLKNGIYNAYIKNANASAVRLIIQYF